SSGRSPFKGTLSDGVPSLAQQLQKVPGGQAPMLAHDLLYFASIGVIRRGSATSGQPLWIDTTHPADKHQLNPMIADLSVSVMASRPPAFETAIRNAHERRGIACALDHLCQSRRTARTGIRADVEMR